MLHCCAGLCYKAAWHEGCRRVMCRAVLCCKMQGGADASGTRQSTGADNPEEQGYKHAAGDMTCRVLTQQRVGALPRCALTQQ
jgi:hypothetical protein